MSFLVIALNIVLFGGVAFIVWKLVKGKTRR